jgi:hypothetical protein
MIRIFYNFKEIINSQITQLRPLLSIETLKNTKQNYRKSPSIVVNGSECEVSN